MKALTYIEHNHFALLDKPERRKVDIWPDYVGAVVPDEFIVGYGLDYDQLGRSLKDIYVVTE